MKTGAEVWLLFVSLSSSFFKLFEPESRPNNGADGLAGSELNLNNPGGLAWFSLCFSGGAKLKFPGTSFEADEELKPANVCVLLKFIAGWA